MGNKRNYNLLDQFWSRECEIYINLLTEDTHATYLYPSFYYTVEDENIVLSSGTNDELNTYIPLDKIIEVKNLYDDNVYQDSIDIVTDGFIVSVCTIDEKLVPVFPKCHRCGNEIHTPEESIWRVTGDCTYGSEYDYEGGYDDVCGLVFCDSCISEFVGEVDGIRDYIN